MNNIIKLIFTFLIIFGFVFFGFRPLIFSNDHINYVMLITLVLVISIIILLFPTLLFSIRSSKLKKLAKKYNLNFESKKYFYGITNDNDILNEIHGNINKNTIEISDYIITQKGFGIIIINTPLGYTRLKNNENKKEIKGYYWGFPKINELEKWINSIQDNNECDVPNSEYPIAGVKNTPISDTKMIIWSIIIVLIAFLLILLIM